MTTFDEKYIVFKREAWDEFTEDFRATDKQAKRAFEQKQALPDAVVFRTSDILASSLFHTYANMYLTLAKAFAQDHPTRAKNLQTAADYIGMRAMEADDHPAPKWPD
jgi:hypothetical protein